MTVLIDGTRDRDADFSGIDLGQHNGGFGAELTLSWNGDIQILKIDRGSELVVRDVVLCDTNGQRFDIREYIGLYPKRDIKSNIDNAICATLSRTVNTSGTTLVTLLAIFIFGGETIRGFVFALILGVVIGTYSSVFVATPIAYDLQRKKAAKALEAEAKAE